MSDCTTCSLCDEAGKLESSPEVARIASNVEKFADESFTVWRCAHCNSLHSKEDVDLDHYYAHYPLAQARLSYLNRLAFLSRLRLFPQAGIRPQHRVLDYGCGQGHFVNLLRQRGFENVSGYDPYIPEFADPAILATEYDAVVSYGVIEHVPDPAEYLQQLRRLLRPGGTALVATPAADGLVLAQPDPLMLHQPYHRHILSEQAMTALAERHGFRRAHLSRRYWMDRLHPAVNRRFITEYMRRAGGCVDVLYGPVQLSMVVTSPRLLWWLFMGSFSPQPGYMVCVLQAE